MSGKGRRMRLGQTRRAAHARTFHHDRGIRRLRSRNDTEYLLSNPETARRLQLALERSLAGRSRPFPLDRLSAELGLGEEE